MRNFIVGIIATLLVLGCGGLAFAVFGLMPTNADSSPLSLERRIATRALNASLNRRAPRLSNPTAVRLKVEENQLVGIFGEIGVVVDGLKSA
jgi:hypothetical protein